MSFIAFLCCSDLRNINSVKLRDVALLYVLLTSVSCTFSCNFSICGTKISRDVTVMWLQVICLSLSNAAQFTVLGCASLAAGVTVTITAVIRRHRQQPGATVTYTAVI